MKVIVIGGGPAGLVTLKFLATAHDFYQQQLAPIDVQLFEAEDEIGGTFKYRVWDRSEVGICPPLLAPAECSHAVPVC
jgi:dimethylaniline monooxygenase (N-oxide forming)